MFMMTTETDRRNNQQTRNSLLNIDSRLLPGSNHPTEFINFGGKNFHGESQTIPKQYESPKPMTGRNEHILAPADKSIHQDDGYSTDSKSNTSPSTASPLSSSFSSLSTFDGSFISHTSSGGTPPGAYNASTFAMPGNAQRNLAPKHSLIQGNGKIHVNRHAVMAAKKKDVPQDTPDGQVNLEDRLRALTTIEEEEPGLSGTLSRELSRAGTENMPHLVNHARPTSNNLDSHGDNGVSGYFRAVPVEVVAPQIPSDHGYLDHSTNTNEMNYGSMSDGPLHDGYPQAKQPPLDTYEKKWHDYKRYFEKDSDIPLHNIDFSNVNKFIGADSNNAADKDINRQLATNAPSAHSVSTRTQVLAYNRENAADRSFPDSLSAGNPSSAASQDSSNNLQVTFPRYRPDQQENWNWDTDHNQNTTSSSQSDLRYHSLPRNMRSGECFYSDNHQTFQKDLWDPGMTSDRHQQQFQYRDGYGGNQQLQQSFDSLPTKNPQSWSSYQDTPSNCVNNSLPSNYDNQRQQATQISHNQREPTAFSQEDVLLRRSWAASNSRTRHSDSRPQHLLEVEIPNSSGTERYSLDLGNIPQLQQQIRATSEMCLQASKRHVFASSADIYKLFQGQRKPAVPSTSATGANNFPGSRDHSNRHSFHTLPGGSWNKSLHSPLQDHSSLPREAIAAINGKSHLLSTYPPPSHHSSSSPGPLRADHSIALPQTAWTSNNSSSTFLSASTSPSSSLQPLLSEIPHIQRQSSGYSSENELQQIEQNAKAAKKTIDRGEPLLGSRGGINPDQKFVPVDPSLDQDSSSSVTDNEPVYINQPSSATLRSQSAGNRASPMQAWQQQEPPQPSSPPPPPIPARPGRHRLTPAGGSAGQLNRDATSDPNENMKNHMNNWPDFPPTPPITQNQVIHFNKKPVTIKSYVPSLSYSNSNTTYGQIVGNHENLVGGHILSLEPPNPQSSQPENYSRDQLNKNSNLVGVAKGGSSFRPQRSNDSPCAPLSPLEIAQALDVPFATSVISDESGDHLSTLV